MHFSVQSNYFFFCRQFLFLLCLILSATAGKAHAKTIKLADEIMNGVKVRVHDPVASSTVLLVGKSNRGEYICTGSIVAPDMVVTAAHCVQTNPENIRVVFALAADKKHSVDQSHIMKIEGYLAHPQYRGDNYQGSDMADIAVIRLSEKLPEGYRPARILPKTIPLRSGEETIVAGYGITNAATAQGAGQLRKVTAIIHGPVSSTEVAIDETNNKGSCSGDSGGPAFIQRGKELLLWGVISRGDRNCKIVGIYTRISAYDKWIRKAITQLRSERR